MKIRAIMSPSKADEQLGIDLHNPLTESMCFPGGTRVKSLSANAGDKFNLWIWKIPWRRKWQPTLVFLPGEFCGQRSLAGRSPRGCKESDTTEWLTFTFTYIRISSASQLYPVSYKQNSLRKNQYPTNILRFFFFFLENIFLNDPVWLASLNSDPERRFLSA